MKSIPTLPRPLASGSRAILCTSAATLLAAFALCPSSTRAATIITAAGFTETFDVMPLETDWSTTPTQIAGGGATSVDPAGLDAAVAQITAAQLNAPLLESATPGGAGANAQARYNSTDLNASTRPTGVTLTPLMATLENGTGSTVTALDLAYDLATYATTNEDPGLDGHRVYFSLDGLTWTNIEAISGIGTPGNLSTVVDLGSWSSGSELFLLWADDNANGVTDGGFTLDNVFFAPHIVIPPGDTLVWDRANAVGGAPNGDWNLQGGNFWLNGATPDSFADNDIVQFSQNGDANINVTENVAPNQTEVSHATGTYTIGGTGRISGPLVKTGAGTLVLTSGNDFSRVDFDGGLIVSQADDSLGTGIFTIEASGGTLQTDTDTTIGGIRGVGALIKTGAGNLIINGAGNGTGGINVQTGKILAATGPALGGTGQIVTLQDGTSLDITAAAGESTYAGSIVIPAGGTTISVLNASAGLILSTDESLQGSGTITIAGDGALRVRSENFNLTSNFIVNSGTLEYGDGRFNALGTGTVTVNAGGRLAGRSASQVPNNVILNGGDLGTRSGDAVEYIGRIDVTADSTVTLQSYTTPVNSQTILISGVLSGSADLTINGNNPQPDPGGKALVLANSDNTFTGTFRVSPGQILSSEPFAFTGSALNGRPIVLSNGSLRIRDDGTDNDGTILYGNNITVDTGDSTIDISGVFGSNSRNTVEFGTLDIGLVALTVFSDFTEYRARFTGATTLSGDARFIPNTDLALEGAISGAFGITVSGFSPLRVNGANTYTGPTNVESGFLIVNGSIAAESAVSVTGGTLGGTGVVNGAVTASGSGALAPGDGGKGILTVAGDVTFGAGSSFSLEIAHTSVGPLVPGTDYDQLIVGVGSGAVSTGQVNLSGANLVVTLGLGIQQDDLLFILKNDGTDPILGTFQNRPDDSIFQVGAQPFLISYDADVATNSLSGGNDIALLAVPEPGATSLLLMGGLGLLSRRRRRSEQPAL